MQRQRCGAKIEEEKTRANSVESTETEREKKKMKESEQEKGDSGEKQRVLNKRD